MVHPEDTPRQRDIAFNISEIAKHHLRIASAIEAFWGHAECGEYLHSLILSGSDNSGNTRVGFKADVMAALLNLTVLNSG
jgi:hypothetical protein